jgi:hypothetical protein
MVIEEEEGRGERAESKGAGEQHDDGHFAGEGGAIGQPHFSSPFLQGCRRW